MKKRKTYAAVMFAAGLLSLFACVPAFADTEGFSEEYSRFQNPDGLMDEEDANQLNEELDEISHNRNFDVTATLVNSDWYLSTSGYGITAFTDAGIQYIGVEITSQLADGEYLEAFEKYIELCDDFIDAANNGEVYDTDHMPRKPLSAIWLGISFAVGLGGALLLVGVNKSELKSVRMQEEAKNYVRPGSMKVTKSGDFFLYRHVTRTERPKANPKSSGGGGSSTHTSSSGRTHGGGGGKF